MSGVRGIICSFALVAGVQLMVIGQTQDSLYLIIIGGGLLGLFVGLIK